MPGRSSRSEDSLSSSGKRRGKSDKKKAKLESSCGIRSFNEYQDSLLGMKSTTANADVETGQLSKAWAGARATNHNNGHFSSSANAGATLLKNDNHSVYKTTAEANAEFGLGGAIAEVDADVSVYSYEDDEVEVKVGKGYLDGGIGLGLGGAKAKVGAGVDLVNTNVKLSERQEMDVNLGLNVDTGAEIGADGVSASLLGLGFSLGRKTGFSTPFGSVSFKLW